MPADDRELAAQCRVAIVDDDVAVLRIFERMAGMHGYAAAVFASGRDFLSAVARVIPDILVLDLRMPDMDGIAVQRELLARGIEIPTIFISAHPDLAASVLALRGGAIDFLEKPCDDRQFATALRRAADVSARTRSRRTLLREIASRAHTLTPRERQVFELVVTGRLNKQIASTLGTSEKTIKVHRARVMAKMHAESVADLVRMFDVLATALPRADASALPSGGERPQRERRTVSPDAGQPEGEDRTSSGSA
jgi:FixJ family two-component response regulator